MTPLTTPWATTTLAYQSNLTPRPYDIRTRYCVTYPGNRLQKFFGCCRLLSVVPAVPQWCLLMVPDCNLWLLPDALSTKITSSLVASEILVPLSSWIMSILPSPVVFWGVVMFISISIVALSTSVVAVVLKSSRLLSLSQSPHLGR